MADMLKAAKGYATQGIPVFPIYEMKDGKCSCGRAECRNPGKHPRTEHGLKDATNNLEVITQWWTKWPQANIGGVCGAVSNMVVLDVDPRHGGLESLETLKSEHPELKLPDGPRVKTGGGGYHIFFAHPGQRVPPAVAFRPGLDLRADDSYIVLPPSNHASGGAYVWEKIPRGETLPAIPQWLFEAMMERARKEPVITTIDGEPIPEGRRNQTLTSIAGKLRHAGASDSAIFIHLKEVNEARCSPPLTEDELMAISRSVARYSPSPEAEIKVAPSGNALFDEVVSEIKRLMHFTQPHHAYIMAIYSFETYLYQLLPAVFYLAFRGTKGSGKTTGTEISVELSHQGLMAGDASAAALSRSIDEGWTLGIDELDELRGEVLEVVQAALRHGYRPNNYYLRWDYKAGTQERIKIYGPKVMNFRTDVEDALADRTYIITMEKRSDPDMVNKVLANLTRDLSPLREKMEAFCAEVKQRYTKGDVLSWIMNEDFKKQIDQIVKVEGAPRDAELASIVLVIGKLLDIDVLDVINKSLKEKNETTYIDDVDDITEVVRDLWRDRGMPDYIDFSSVKDILNVRRKDKGEKPLSDKKMHGLLRDMGLRDGIELKRVPGNGRMGIYFTEDTIKRLTSAQNSYQALSFTRTFTDSQQTLTEREASTDFVRVVPQPREGSREAFERKLREISLKCSSSNGEGDGTFTENELSNAAISEGVKVQPSDIYSQIDKWKKAGELIEPKLGRYKFV